MSVCIVAKSNNGQGSADAGRPMAMRRAMSELPLKLISIILVGLSRVRYSKMTL